MSRDGGRAEEPAPTDVEACLHLDPRLKVWYTVDRAPAGEWKYSVGFIDDTMISEQLPAASAETLVLMCGPPPMINFACKPNLEKLGFTSKQMIAF